MLVVFGVAMIGLGGYAYYRGPLSRAELALVVMGSVVWVAYATVGALAFLSVPQFVADVLAAVTGLSFVGLFLYWAYNRESEPAIDSAQYLLVADSEPEHDY